jgi:hypothetical protein
MSDRMKELLDRAAGEVRPREPDPVGAVLGRVRVARRRRIAGAAVAAVAACAVAVGAVVVGPALTGPAPDDPAATTPAPTGTPVTGPATVTVENGVVRAGGLRLPLPGWTVATGDQAICDTVDHTVFIDAAPVPGGPCNDPTPYITVRGVGADTMLRKGPPEVPQQLILAGGQPAFVERGMIGALDPGPDSESRLLVMRVPWSGVSITFSMPRGELRELVAAIRTEPLAPGPLVVPPGATRVTIAGSGTGMSVGTIVDPARIGELRAALTGIREQVPAGFECPRNLPRQLVTFQYPDPGTVVMVLVSAAAECGEATSSHGGRVKLPADLWAPLSAKVTR